MPGDIPVVLSPKTDVQMESASSSVLAALNGNWAKYY